MKNNDSLVKSVTLRTEKNTFSENWLFDLHTHKKQGVVSKRASLEVRRRLLVESRGRSRSR